MTEEAKKEALRELDRLAKMPPAAAEYTVARTYIDWLVSMPWQHGDGRQCRHRCGADDPRRGPRGAREDQGPHPRVPRRQEDPPVGKDPILCFVGPPGVGKTSLGRSIARALGRKFHRISLGGMRDEAEIRGHRRTYIGALPARSSRGSGAPERRTRSSCSTRSTSSAWTSGAIRPRRCSRCSIRSRTPRSATTTWTWRSICRACCSSRRRT